ncbi:hypothetical protein RJT34_24461 [Clitoria ternatea]|uniref:SCP domain-containing protein n=1 Tax=Clitoria ternatea TaxID=43366 RepID=A0AAN9FPQ5_CLITE
MRILLTKGFTLWAYGSELGFCEGRSTLTVSPPPRGNNTRRRGGHGGKGGRHRVNARQYFGWVPKNDMHTSVNQVIAQEFLHAHNWVRKVYKLPELVWDEKLASYARGYLMQRYEDCMLVHSDSDFGENVFWGKKLHWTASDATYWWYVERQWYDFKTLTCLPPPKNCGHFTQLVWRDSARVGCALQHCRNSTQGMLIACEYDPPGNYDNEHPLKHHEYS